MNISKKLFAYVCVRILSSCECQHFQSCQFLKLPALQCYSSAIRFVWLVWLYKVITLSCFQINHHPLYNYYASTSRKFFRYENEQKTFQSTNDERKQLEEMLGPINQMKGLI